MEEQIKELAKRLAEGIPELEKRLATIEKKSDENKQELLDRIIALEQKPSGSASGGPPAAPEEVHQRLSAMETTHKSERQEMEKKLESNKKELHDLVSSLEEKFGSGDTEIKKGAETQIMKKVATRLQDFESQITAQLSHVTTDFDKKLSHVHRSSGTTKAIDGVGPDTGLDTMAEDVDQLKFDVGELKDLLTNSKGEVNHIRRIVLACERDMEDFTAAMDAVNVDLDEMRARVDATHSIITSRQRVEATMTAEISTMRLDIGDIQEALKNHDSWMEDVSNTLQQMQEKEDNTTEDLINLKNEFITKLDGKVDNVAWKEANDDLDAAIKTVRDMISSLRLDVDARHGKVDEILSTMRHDITSVETNLEESKVAVVRSDLERTGAEREAFQNCLQYLGEKIEAVEHRLSLRGGRVGPEAIQLEEVAYGTKSEASISDGSPTWSEPAEPVHQENFFGL